MREQPRRDWQTATKRQWVTPTVREIVLTSDLLRLFDGAESTERAADSRGPARRARRPD